MLCCIPVVDKGQHSDTDVRCSWFRCQWPRGRLGHWTQQTNFSCCHWLVLLLTQFQLLPLVGNALNPISAVAIGW